MTSRIPWTRQQLLVALSLYCRLPYGRIHHGNPEIIRYAKAIGRTPSALAMKLVNIAGIDPVITSSGRRGLTNASRADREMWEQMHSDWNRFVAESHQAMDDCGLVPESEEDLAEIEPDLTHRRGEDRIVQSTARRGQAFFRSAILSAYDRRCCVTGLSIPTLLIASHIVPWTHDETNRVNPKNGLLLSVLHDRAFDRGLITFDEELNLRVSPAIPNDAFFSYAVASYDGKPIRCPDKFAPDQKLLAYHREHIFQE